MLSKRLTFLTVLVPLLAGGCSVTAPQSGRQASNDWTTLRDKYEDCIRDMRGDVFAERTCEAYLAPAAQR
jgi:hypothetical protein